MSGQPARVLEIISGFSTQYPLGGIENYVMELCQAFDQSLVAPTVVGMWNYGSEVEAQWIAALNAKGIATISGVQWNAEQPYQSFWKSFKKLEHDLQGQSFDIIHSHTQFGDVAALLLKQRIHAKALVRTIHNEYEWKKKPLRRALLTSLLLPLFFDLEIGISQAVADKLNRRLVARLFRRDSISIHNAIYIKKFEKIDADREAVLLRLGLNHPHGPVIGAVGRMVEQKGLTYLVRAVPLVSQQFPEAVFIIVGSGELEASLRAQSAQLGVEDHVLFTGHRLDVPEILASLDLFVSSSLWEGLPTVILEAMASGIPVVATDIPGTREIIQNQVNGWLVQPGDARALADGILRGIGDEGARKKFRCQGLETVQEYTIQAVAKAYEKTYRNLAAAG